MAHHNFSLLWDLDGTIIDPKAGIIGSYQKLFEEQKLPVPETMDLKWVIGPSLRDCIKSLFKIQDAHQIEHLVTRYRYWYVTSGLMLGDPVYPGTGELLAELRVNHRCSHYLATAKAWPYAKTILDHHGLSRHFSGIYGSELDGTRSKKSLLIQWILDNQPEINIKKCFMIGDRIHDIEAAKYHDIPTIGVSYGYGGFDELSKAGATHIVSSVPDLRSLLLSLTN